MRTSARSDHERVERFSLAPSSEKFVGKVRLCLERLGICRRLCYGGVDADECGSEHECVN